VTRDIGSISLISDGGGESLEFFRGVVRTAELLGHRVTIREIRGPGDRLHTLVASIEDSR
jgi:hypothetical protein